MPFLKSCSALAGEQITLSYLNSPGLDSSHGWVASKSELTNVWSRGAEGQLSENSKTSALIYTDARGRRGAAIKWSIKWSTVSMWTLKGGQKFFHTSTLHLSISTTLRPYCWHGTISIPCRNRHLLGFKWITLCNKHDYGLIAKSIPC